MKTTAKKAAPVAPDDMVDSVQAAKIIGLKPCTLRQWRHEQREGQPEFVKLPTGSIRYSRSHLEAWLAARTNSY